MCSDITRRMWKRYGKHFIRSVSTSGSNTVSSDQTAGNTKDNSRSSDTIKFSELFKNDVYVYKYERSVGTEITKSTDISYVAKYKSDGRYEGDYIGARWVRLDK